MLTVIIYTFYKQISPGGAEHRPFKQINYCTNKIDYNNKIIIIELWINKNILW